MARIWGRAALAVLLATTAGGTALAQKAAPARITVPPIAFTERTLPNGLKVIAIRDTATPNVTVQVWYDVGSKHDPEGRSGFAHLFEHILSRKTRNMPYNMINRLTENVGGVRNASTWFDRTNYYEIVPGQYLETMLWTHAERMARPVIDKEVFETERNVVKEEFRQRILAPPYGRFRLVVDENAYDTMPNRRPGIGSLAQLDAATHADALAFHEAYYGPDTATLIVAGNFDPATLDRLVDKYFAGVQRRAKPVPLKITATEKPRIAPRQVTAYAPNVALPLVATTWRIPGSAHPDLAPLTVLDAILSAGNSSRLKRALLFDKQLATSASVQLSDVEDGGYFGVQATVASGKTVADTEAALAAEVARMRDAPVTAAELSEAKNEILSEALNERETFSGRAFALGEALVRTGDPRALDKRLTAVGKVTAADVQRVARQYLTPQSRVDYRYLDEKQRPAGEKDNWQNPVPMPTWGSVSPATRAPLTLAPEAEREAPPAPSAALAVTQPVISETKLANGLQVVTARTGSVPLATLALNFAGGGATDPVGRTGLAALTADLATRGTATRSADQIAGEIEALGANLTATAGADGTIFAVTAPAANIEAAGRILVDVVRNATFPDGEFERARRQRIDGLSVAMKDPGALAQMVMQPLVFGAAPYGAVTTPASLTALTRADLVAQRDRWWRPDVATVIMTGGIDPAQARGVAERLFADWRAEGAAPALPVARAGTPRGPRVVVVDMPGAGQAAVAAGLRIPPRRDAGYQNLQVANAVLGAGSNGRLFQEVRTKRALSYGAGSGLAARSDDGLLLAASQTKNESAADVVAIFKTELDRLGTEPLDAETIAQRKAFLSGGLTRQAESGRDYAYQMTGLVQQGLPAAEAAQLAAKLDAVTPAAASAAAKANVAAARANIVVVGDAKLFIDKLRVAYPDLQMIPADKLDLNGTQLTGATPARR